MNQAKEKCRKRDTSQPSFPADEQPTKAVDPRAGACDDPATGARAGLLFTFAFLLTARLDARYVVTTFQELASIGRVIALIEANVLSLALRGLETMDRYVGES